MKNSISLRKTKKYILVLLVSFIFVTITFVIIGFIPFGKKDTFTFSGTERIASFYYELWDNSRNGSIFFFSLKSGVGYDFASVITYYLLNPLGFIYLLLPKNSLLIFSNTLFFIESSISGLFFYLLLEYISEADDNKSSNIINVLFSALYSLMPFIYCSGINSVNILSITMFPLILLGICKIHNGKKSILFIVATVISICASMNLSVEIMLFIVIGCFVQGFFDIKTVFRSFSKILIYGIIVIGFTFPVILTNIHSSFFEYNNVINLKNYLLHIENYKTFVFIIYSFFVLSYIHFYRNMKNKISNRVLNKSIALVPFVLLSVFTICFLSFLAVNREKTKEYSDTKTARIDVAIDYIKEKDSSAKIYVSDDEINTANPISYIILGYDYVLIPDKAIVPDSCLEYYDCVADIDIYSVPRNKKSSGSYCSLQVSDDFVNLQLKSEYPFEKLNDLTENLTGIDDIFIEEKEEIHLTPDPEDPTNLNKMIINYSFEDKGDYYIKLSNVVHLGEMDNGDVYTTKLEMSNSELRKLLDDRELVRLNCESFETFKDVISDSYASASISGQKIQIEDHNTNSIFIPYDISNAFRVKNGNNASLFKVLDDRTAILETDNDHVEMYYYPEYFFEGLIISLLSIILLILILCIESIHTNKIIKIFNKITEFIYENKVYVYAVLINLAIYIAAVIVSKCVPFGKNSFVCTDGYLISYPYIRGYISDIKNGSFNVPDFSLGAGWNGMTSENMIILLCDPIRLLLFFMNKSNSLFVYNIVYLVHFLLIGPSIIMYLTHRPYGKVMKKNELKLIPISMAYSLSSYVVAYYSFFDFMEYIIMLPLIILALERLIYKKKYGMYVLILTYQMIFSPYYAFLICEFIILCFLTFSFKDIKDFATKLIRLALFSVVSAFISLFRLVPFYIVSKNCGYDAKDDKAFELIHYFSQSIVSSFSDLDMMYKSVIVTADWTHANAYCGILLVLVLGVFVCIKTIPKSNRIKRIALIIFLYIAFGNELLNFIMHGFHFQNLVPNRFAIFFIFMMVIVFYDVIQNYKELYKDKSVLIISISSALLLLLVVYNNEYKFNKFAVSALFIVTYLIVILFGYKKDKAYKCTRLLLMILSIELIVSGWHTLGSRDDSTLITEHAVEIMTEYSEEYGFRSTPLTREEVINAENFNTAKMIGANSVSMFDSQFQKEQSHLASSYDVVIQNNNILYSAGNPLANLFLNTKYYMSEGNENDYAIPRYYNLIEEKENIKLFKDDYVSDAGIIIPVDAELSDDYYAGSIKRQNDFVNRLIGEDLYKIVDADINIGEKSEFGWASVDVSILDDVTGDLYICNNKEMKFLGHQESNDENQFYTDIELYEGFDESDLTFAVLDENSLGKLSEYVKEHSIDNYTYDVDNKELLVSYDISNDGKLMLPIPAYKNWRCYVDGKETSFDDSLGGMTVLVPSGKHKVSIVYKDDSFIVFNIISSIIFIVFLVVLFADCKGYNIFRFRGVL